MFTQESISLLRKYIPSQLCPKHTYLHVMEYLITTLNIKERSCEADMKKFSKHFLRDCKQRLSNDHLKHLRWRTLKLLLDSSPSRMFVGVLATSLESSTEKLWTGKEIKICIS